MAQYTRKQVVDAAHELGKMMADIEEIDRFKQLEAKLNENLKVQAHIKKIKALQKQAVNLQAYGKGTALEKVEQELDRLQSELDEIPVVAEFKETQVVINDILQMVSSTISREVTNEVIRSTGGDVLKGETGSKENTGCSH
ncbi:hypothetical protein EQV77_03740 [Halobacillus fulvus]|nr:hypothetical protein EQV77_03740 [Halobacillus fulvus]